MSQASDYFLSLCGSQGRISYGERLYPYELDNLYLNLLGLSIADEQLILAY